MKYWLSFFENHLNIVNTLIEKKFGEYIREVMIKREKMLIKRKRMEVNALPEFKDLIRKSAYVSCTLLENV